MRRSIDIRQKNIQGQICFSYQSILISFITLEPHGENFSLNGHSTENFKSITYMQISSSQKSAARAEKQMNKVMANRRSIGLRRSLIERRPLKSVSQTNDVV